MNKFNIDDTVWVIGNRTVKSGKVTSIYRIYQGNEGKHSIEYRIDILDGAYKENELFKTKEELIASL